MQAKYGWALLVVLAGALPARAVDQPAISELAQARVQDLSVTLVTDQADTRELSRMGKDFVDLYRFKRAQVKFREPGCMRMDAQAGLIRITYVVNQARRMFAIPILGVRTVRDISHSPSSRQGLLEAGLIAPSLLTYVQARPMGCDVAEGMPVWRYDLTYDGDTSRRHEEIAIDPQTRTVVERRLYQADGTLKARFVYSEPTPVADGIWVPRRAKLYSPWGKQAATTHYEGLCANAGIPPAVFAF